MIHLFRVMFPSRLGIERINKGMSLPLFYQGEDAIVFPPVSDIDKSGDCEAISTALTEAAAFLKESNFLGKKLIFPVVEEQRFLFFPPRNHWVTLHYDPSTQNATLIDSRSFFTSFWYPTTAMQASLVNGLKTVGLEVKQFKVEYQGIQDDQIRCGAWTAVNIELLANGRSIDDVLKELTASDRDIVVLHNQNMLDTGKNNGVYKPGIYDSDTPSLGSDASDDVDDCEYPDDPNEGTWRDTATDLMQHTLNNPNALTIALIARESITHNGNKLSDNVLGQFSALDILANVESTHQADGFGIFDSSRLGSGLRTIGFDEHSIGALTLHDILKYDAAISLAISNAGDEIWYAERLPMIECPIKFNEMHAAHAAFKMTLFASLKRQIENILQESLNNAALLPEHVDSTLSAIGKKIKSGHQITLEFKDRDGVNQKLFLDPARFFSSQRQRAEMISLIQSTLRLSGSNGNLVIDTASSPQSEAIQQPIIANGYNGSMKHLLTELKLNDTSYPGLSKDNESVCLENGNDAGTNNSVYMPGRFESDTPSDIPDNRIITSDHYNPPAESEIDTGFVSGEPSEMNISMQVLGGFIAVLGCAAVATAFILLNAATAGVAGIVAGLGVAAIAVGIGLFATSTYKKEQAMPSDSLGYSISTC